MTERMPKATATLVSTYLDSPPYFPHPHWRLPLESCAFFCSSLSPADVHAHESAAPLQQGFQEDWILVQMHAGMKMIWQ